MPTSNIFLGDALFRAAYILNCVPSKSISTTPYELWTGKRPDLSYMRLGGQQAMFTATPMLMRNLSLEQISAYLLDILMNLKGM